jgi:hypothetical protein
MSDETMPADLAALRAKHPEWRFGTVWASAASGPDRRRVWASRDGILLSAWDAAALSENIRHEEREWGTGRE